MAQHLAGAAQQNSQPPSSPSSLPPYLGGLSSRTARFVCRDVALAPRPSRPVLLQCPSRRARQLDRRCRGSLDRRGADEHRFSTAHSGACIEPRRRGLRQSHCTSSEYTPEDVQLGAGALIRPGKGTYERRTQESLARNGCHLSKYV